MPEIEGCKSSVKSFPFNNDLSIAAEVLHEIEPNVSQITPKSTNFMTRILERSESVLPAQLKRCPCPSAQVKFLCDYVGFFSLFDQAESQPGFKLSSCSCNRLCKGPITRRISPRAEILDRPRA